VALKVSERYNPGPRNKIFLITIVLLLLKYCGRLFGWLDPRFLTGPGNSTVNPRIGQRRMGRLVGHSKFKLHKTQE
jgi:hypothetical protein